MNGTLETQAPRLMDGFSVEITGKDAAKLATSAPILPSETSVNIAYLGNESHSDRVRAAEVAKQHQLQPIPHLSARRITSTSEFESSLSALQAVGATAEMFLVGGDPAIPAGPFEDALSLISTGILPEYGVRRVGVAGYPDGHPGISRDALDTSLAEKISALQKQSISASITTQFGFDAHSIAEWIADIRGRGIDVPVRVGVPGPAGVRRLLGYARRFGIASSTGIAQKYGFSITNLMGTAGPDRFIDELADILVPQIHGQVALHFYTFGGIQATAEWAQKYQAGK